MRVIMPSVTTMALSTSMPIAIIMAPSEIRCSSIPAAAITPTVPVTVSNSTAPTITPARQPINRHSAAMTVVMEAVRFSRNSPIDRSTRRCCSKSGIISMPTGRSCCSSSSRVSTALPTRTTFWVSLMAIPRAKMRCPSCRTISEGRLVSSRETLATSPRRIMDVSPGRAISSSSSTASLRSSGISMRIR
ncbi:MAG: Uncharacterised protein [Halieaceae bacterium]|nr:MAG: Uncharacterised protein [Halieaceae bacterium]